MNYISVKEAAIKFNLSERRIQKLCESRRIEGANMLSGVWIIPSNASKPPDGRFSTSKREEGLLTLKELCEKLSISPATGHNWIKTNKIQFQETKDGLNFFTVEYVDKLYRELKTGKNQSLRSRRNKGFISGNSLYSSYISDKSLNLEKVSELMSLVSNDALELNTKTIKLLIADCAIKLMCCKNNKCYQINSMSLQAFLEGRITFGEYDRLIYQLIENRDEALLFSASHKEVFSIEYVYESDEDVLGLIYLSCRGLNTRKQSGSYFTPTKIVKKLVKSLNIETNRSVCDPCCGGGNFLLQLPEHVNFKDIFAYDIDEVSVLICRINMALKFSASTEEIQEHIKTANYLNTDLKKQFDYIIGNPPWGYKFSSNDVDQLKQIYSCTSGNSVESYDVFVERSLKNLNEAGELAFVLPESILNVKSHLNIRKLILEECKIKSISYIGNAFDGVQCPSILLVLQKGNNQNSTLGIKIETKDETFTIKTKRKLTPAAFNLSVNDTEYKVLDKITHLQNVTFLKNQAEFALGIVTGNNKKYVTKNKTDDNEPVLKGSDINKFHYKISNNYLSFTPSIFQQVAPTEMYRAKEKLFYKFISNQLVFAYDNKQTLSLNSCNIVIPKIPNLEMKYILAVLNSRIAQFIFCKQFSSIKVLRSHIESIPIPEADKNVQNSIVNTVNDLIDLREDTDSIELFNTLDLKLSKLFNLNSLDYLIIKNATDKFF